MNIEFLFFVFLSNLKWKMENFVFNFLFFEVLQFKYIFFRIIHRILDFYFECTCYCFYEPIIEN